MMKRFLLLAAVLVGMTAGADVDAIEFQRLYWQIGNGWAADQADRGRFYATVGDGDKIYLGGYTATRGNAVGIVNETDLVTGGTPVFSNYQSATYFFELLDSTTTVDGQPMLLGTSMGVSYADLLASGAFAIDYVGLAQPSMSPTRVFTTYTIIPEPTSGILMLLGLAGLALKRKRA